MIPLNQPNDCIMKRYILYCFVILTFISCKETTQSSQETVVEKTPVSYEKMEQLSWVLGDWTNINDQTQSYEYWQKNNDSVYVASSMTLRDTDTVFAERMKLYQENGVIKLYVETVGPHPNPVLFTQKENAEHLFSFENPKNEFPSLIVYTQPEFNKIHAWVEGLANGNPQRLDFYLNKAE